MITEDLIEKLDICLKDNCSHIYDYYQDPLNDADIERYMSMMQVDNADYRTLYKWKNGLDISSPEQFPNEFRIMVYGNFISLSSAIDIYQEIKKHNQNWWWENTQIVLMDSLQGECLLLETDKNSDFCGFLSYYTPSGIHAGEPITVFDNLESMLLSIVTLYENGAIKYDKNASFLEIDFEMQRKICSSINTRSEYWKT